MAPSILLFRENNTPWILVTSHPLDNDHDDPRLRLLPV